LAGQTGAALTARSDRADEDSLADFIADNAFPISSITPTGSCPIVSPGCTG
jgi:hypothetical protein